MFIKDLVFILPEIFLIYSLILFLMFGLFGTRLYTSGFQTLKISVLLARLNVLPIVLSILLLVNYNFNSLDYLNLLNYQLFVSDFYISVKILLLLIFLLINIFFVEYYKYELSSFFEYLVLLTLAVVSMLFIISSSSLMVVYICIEIQSLIFYILATGKPFSNFSTEAGLKYFVLGAFASGLLMFGFSLLYGFTGIVNFDDFTLFSSDFESPGVLLAILFIIAGLFFKIGCAPFHMWLPDVYEGVPTIITAVFSVLPKMPVLVLIAKLFFNVFFFYKDFWFGIFLVCSFLSLVFGSLGALSQLKFKRLLAYSAITHVGYLVLTLSVATFDSFYALLLYLLVYFVVTLNIFGILLNVRNFSNGEKMKTLVNFISLVRSNFLLALSMALSFFSLAGIPPLSGFFAKFFLFLSVVKADLYFVVFIAFLFSLVSAVYYVRFIKIMFFDSGFEYKWSLFKPLTKVQSYVIYFTCMLNLIFCVYPKPFVLFAYYSSLNFYLV